jgi:hypothetical protein
MYFLNKLFTWGAHEPEESTGLAQKTPSSLASLVALGPVAAGGIYGFKALRSNEPGAILGLRTNNLADAGATVGDSVRRMQAARTAAQAQSTEKFAESLRANSGEKVKEILRGNVEKRNAFLQAMLSTLEQPGVALGQESSVSALRTQIVDLMRHEAEIVDEQAEILVRSTLDTMMESSTQETKAAFKHFQGEFNRIAPFIQAPSTQTRGMKPVFQTVDDGVFDFLRGLDSGSRKTSAVKNYEQLTDMLSGTRGARVEVGRVVESGGMQGAYARVYAGKQFVKTIPLSVPRIGGVPIVRLGEGMQTAYAGSRGYGSATALHTALESLGPSPTGPQITAAVQKSGAVYGLETHELRQFRRELEGAGRNIFALNSRELGQRQRTMLDRVERAMGATGSTDPFLAKQAQHLEGGLRTNRSLLTITGMEDLPAGAREQLRPRLAAAPGGMFEAAAPAEVGRLPGGGEFAHVGLRVNSPINSVRPIGELSRHTLPVTARIEQVPGRKGMFLPGAALASNEALNSVGRALSTGGTFHQWNQNVLWADNMVVNSMNKVHILDVREGGSRFGIGPEGGSYVGGRQHVQVPLTKTVIDPQGTGRGSRKLTELLRERHEKALGPLIVEQQELPEFFKKYGGFLGTGGAGQEVNIANYTGLKRLSMQLDPLTPYSETGGTPRIHLMLGGVFDTTGQGKGFGGLFKGVMKEGTPAAMAGLRAENPFVDTLMKRLGIQSADTIFAGPGMLKKASHILALQMLTGYGTTTKHPGGAAGLFDQIHKEVQIAGKEFTQGPRESARNFATRRQLLATTDVLSGRMAKAKVPAVAAGGVLAGIFSKEIAGAHGVEHEAVRKIITRHWGEKGGAAVMKEAAEGFALGAAGLTAGPLPAILRGAEASVTPRFFQFLQHQLQSVIGLSQDATSEMLASILASKPGAAKHMNIVKGLTEVQGTLRGEAGLLNKELAGLPRVSAKDFSQLQPDDIRGFLQQHKKGFMLSFGSSDTAMGKAAQRAFGAEEILLRGGDLLAEMKGATIATTQGPLHILDEYTRQVTHLQRNLVTIQQTVGRGEKELVSAIQTMEKWQGSMSELWGKSVRGLLKGKIEGSAFAQLSPLSLTQKAGVSVAVPEVRYDAQGLKSEAGEKLFRRAKRFVQGRQGAAVLVDSQYFMDSMRSFISGTEKSLMAENPALSVAGARVEARKQAGRRAARFFTGMEGGAQPRGVTSLFARFPLLGPGHVQTVEVGRWMGEVGAGDKTFKAFTSTREGAAALAKLEATKGVGKIAGFRDIANLGGKGKTAVGAFFGSMLENTHKFMSEGGGKIHVTDYLLDVHYMGKKGGYQIDLGTAYSAIGDADGDIGQLKHPTEKQGTSLRKANKSGGGALALGYKVEQAMLIKEAKQGMANLAASMTTGATSLDAVAQDILKEQYAKSIGQIDVALDHLRTGIVGTMREGEELTANRLLAALAAVEEVGTIGAKHSPTAINLANITTEATQRLLRGDSAPFTNLLNNYMFRGSDVMSPGGLNYTIGGATGQVADVLGGTRNLAIGSEEMALLERSRYMYESGLTGTRTAPSLAKLNSAQWSRVVGNRESVQMAMALGERETAEAISNVLGNGIGKIRHAAETLDKRMLGPLALGVGGSLLLGSLMGNEGYAPEPILSPGEVVSPRVGRAIRGGNLLAPKDTGPSPEDFNRGGPHRDMINRPINTQQNYYSRSNAYQIRGQATSTGAVSDFMNFMNTVGGSGSVLLNDHRRPITPHYIDRFTTD